MPYDDNRPGFFGSLFTYAPAIGGAGVSAMRATQVLRGGGVAAASTIATSSSAIHEAAANLASSVAARTAGFNTDDAILRRLGDIGIETLEFDTLTSDIVNNMSNTPQGRATLYSFLTHPNLGLSATDISAKMALVDEGSNIVDVVRPFTADNPENRQLFFGALADNSSISTSTSPYSLSFATPPKKISAPLVSRVDALDLRGPAKARFQKLGQEGIGSLYDNLRAFKVSVPGTVAKGGGTGFNIYAQFRLKETGRWMNIPLELNTGVKFGSGQVMPVDLFHHGRYFQTKYALTKMKPGLGANQAVNYAEGLMWGKDQVIADLMALRNINDVSEAARESRARLRSFDSYNLTSEAVNPSGRGVYIPSLRTRFGGIRTQAALISGMVEPLWWPDLGKVAGMPANRHEGYQRIIEDDPNAFVGASPKPTGARGLYATGKQPFKVPFAAERRVFQSWLNPMWVSEKSLKSFSEKFGPLGGNVKPWNRWVNPLMSGMGEDLGSMFHYSAAFVLPPGMTAGMKSTIGEGELLVRGTGTPITSSQYDEMLDATVARGMKGAPRNLSPGQLKSYERSVRKRATYDLAFETGVRPMGPNVRFMQEYRVSMGLGESEIISKFQAGGGKAVDIYPGDILGMRRQAGRGATIVTPKEGMFASQSLVGMEQVHGVHGPEWRLSVLGSAPTQEAMKVFGGTKATVSTMPGASFEATAGRFGLPTGVEAIATNAELLKNDVFLRTQQITALQGKLSADQLDVLNADLDKFMKTQGKGSGLFEYMARYGTGYTGTQELTQSQQSFFGMVGYAKHKMGLSLPEMSEIFAAQMYTGPSLLDITPGGAAAGAGPGTIFGNVLGHTQAAELRSLMGSQTYVTGLLPVSPANISGMLTGRVGSIEPRTIQALARSLPADVSGAVIGDIASRLEGRDLGAYNIASQWIKGKKFGKGVAAKAITDVGDIPAQPFHATKRMKYTLPDWAVPEGSGKYRTLILPSLAEMDILETPISAEFGNVKPVYQGAVDNLFNSLRNAMETGKGRDSARALVAAAFQEQHAIYTRSQVALAKGRVSGSTYAHVKSWGALPMPKPAGRNVFAATDAVFESMMKGLGASPGYRKYLETLWTGGSDVPVVFGRHPSMPQHSAQIAYMRRADPYGARGLQRTVYMPERTTLAVTPEGEKLYTTSFYSGTARTADMDGDQVFISMAKDRKTFQKMASHLESNAGVYNKAIVEDSIMRQAIGDMWKAKVKGGGVSIAQAAAGDFVAKASALGNITDVGMLSNTVNMLSQANLLMPTEGAAGKLGPRRTIEQLLYALEEAPISSKHSGGGQSAAREISERIHRIMNAPGERLAGRAVSQTAGERVVEYLFGTASGGGKLRSELGLDPLFQAGGLKVDLPNEGMSVGMEITPELKQQYSKAIDDFVDASGPDWMRMWQRKAASIKRMNLRSMEDVRQMLDTQTSSLFMDKLLNIHQLAGRGPGSGAGGVLGTNMGIKIRGAISSARGVLDSKWQYISKPLMMGVAGTAVLYNLLSGPGYAGEPLTMPGEQVDPRVLAAIKSGTLLSGDNAGGGYTFDTAQEDRAAVMSQRARQSQQLGMYGRAASQYDGRIYQPSARIAAPSPHRYRMSADVSNYQDAAVLAQHFQANIPHARTTSTVHTHGTNYLAGRRLEEQL